MQKTDLLIRTKLRLPYTRPGLISRPQLQEQFVQGLCGPLTLITAPAGFGKTTLMASCVSHVGMPVAWLSLDKNDNQIWRFLSYFIAALQEADNTIGIKASQLLEASQQVTPETILINLINDLDRANGELVLVLDDYQLISSQAIHEQVAFLLEHCPNTFHLVIATRSDPPLPIPRLRARGQLVNLRTADLRFTELEAAQFLNEVMGLHLDAESIKVLEERTEGWIAGLQMAALSMRDQKDVSGFIEEFSGTNRYILDYLLEEVLASQPPEMQRFLLYTSILERLTGPLCDAIVVMDEGDNRSTCPDPCIPRPSASTLDHLERANLFLLPLDDERKWYRYHHLFADLLRTRLQQTLNNQDIAVLHTRAAQWYEQNGLTYDAIYHASLTSNTEWVERLIEQNYMEVFRRGETSSIRFLTGQLSKELIYRKPLLCIYVAESRAWFGEIDEVDVLLAEAEKHIRSGIPSSDTQSMLGHLDYIKSRVTAMRGDIHRAIELSLTARENTPANNLALQGGIGVMLGYAYFLDGDFPNAIQTLNEAIQSGITANVFSTTIGAYCVLARLYAIQGQLHRAFETYQEAGKFAREAGNGHHGGIGIVDAGIAGILYEWNDLETALTHIKEGMEFIPYWSKTDDLALAYANLARIQQAQGNTAAALDTIEKGAQAIHTSGVFPEAREEVVTGEIRLRLPQGNSLATGLWASSLEKDLSLGDPFRFGNELAHITLARLYMIQRKLDECLGLLSRLEANAQSGGRTGRVIEILILKALTMQKLGEPTQALAILAKSLELAEPEGYIRVFVDEGQSMQLLIAQWLALTNASPLRDYAIHLLSQFDAELQRITTQEKSTPATELVEPLSKREMEVLYLMALGRTNQEIAQQLVVAIGTIKAHAASIYRKLDAANRTEAVARARLLGILP